MPNFESVTIGEATLEGVVQKIGTHDVRVLARNAVGLPIICVGDDVPHNGDAGFAIGCIFIDTANGIPYFNVGTASVANFDTPTLA